MPTLSDSNATVTVNGTPVTSGSPGSAITLNAGANPIHVVVIAQDGTTTKTYTVTVTRSAAGQDVAKKQTVPAQTVAATAEPVKNSATGDTATPTTNTAATTPEPIKAQIIGPVANGGSLSGAQVTLSWNPGRGVTAYQLSVGSTVGGSDLYDGSQGTGLSQAVTLPTDGSPIYVTLQSLIQGAWKANNYVFTAADTTKAVLQSPAEESVLPGATTTFTWNTVPGATSYWLSVGSSEGETDLYDASADTATSQMVTLPADGREIYVTLQTNINGQWLSTTGTFIAAGGTNSPVTAATTALATTPTAGNPATVSPATPPSPPVPATTGAGTSPATGGNTAAGSNGTNGTAPTDGTDATTGGSATGTTPAPTPVAARITAPSDQAVLPPTAVTFTWDAGVGVSEYWLSVGRSVNSAEVYNASQAANTTVTIVLPVDGSPLYVTLACRINGEWVLNQYYYQAALPK
jgi:hypothetical protein